MKRRKLLIGVLCAVILLFASTVSVFAMDFDAEEKYKSIFVVYSGNYVGSGFAVGTNTVVTNAHVIGNANDISLYTYQGDIYRASIYLIDNTLDIAILSVESAEFIPLEIGDVDSLKIGDDIYAIGAPKSMNYTLTKGVISNKDRVIYGQSYIQIDAAINSGNSGGPLLNASGQVVGVNSMKLSDAEGIGLAIPISSFVSFIENNGMVMTDENTVEGEIPFIESVPSEDEKTDDAPSSGITHTESKGTATVILAVLLILSAILNAILIVLLVYRKNKNKDYVPDVSERTDFDIDILE